MSEQTTRLQHYVARQHLRGFSASRDDMVCAFDKKGRRIVPLMNVGNICAESWFYETDSWPKNHFEKKVTHPVEEKFWPFLKRILDGDRRSITPNERKAILQYVAFQDFRTRASFASHRDIASYLFELIKELGAETRFGLPESSDEAERFGRDVMLRTIADTKSTASLLRHMTIRIVQAAPGSAFVIGDDPVFRDNPTFSPAWGRWNGYRSPGTEIFMPLSPRHGLLLFCTKTIRQLDELTKQALAMGGPPRRVWMESTFDGYTARGSFSTDYMDEKCRLYLHSGLFIDVGEDFVAEKNRAALLFASRWVVAEQQESLARLDAMIDDDPELALAPITDAAALAHRSVIPTMVDGFVEHLMRVAPHHADDAERRGCDLRQEVYDTVVRPAVQRISERANPEGLEHAMILRDATVEPTLS